MRSIWEYVVPSTPGNPVSILMPKGAIIVSVGFRFEDPVFYAQVDLEADMEDRVFVQIGITQPIPEGYEAVVGGTYFLDDGKSILHLCEKVS